MKDGNCSFMVSWHPACVNANEGPFDRQKIEAFPRKSGSGITGAGSILRVVARKAAQYGR
jgi:hypothetical protein